MTDFTLKTIGVVRSPVQARKEMPSLGTRAGVEVFPPYREGLYRIEKNSHIWVLAWMSHAERDVLQVIPRGITDRNCGALHGVFAVRSPVRPNPIGLTLTRVLDVHDGFIAMERLDFIEGTPVIDLKPYFAARDLAFAALNQPIGRPASEEALRESLLAQAVNFHGENCADVQLAVEIYARFRIEALGLVEPADLVVTAPAERPHMVDALMGMTRTCLGRGSLRLTSSPLVGFRHSGGEVLWDLEAGGFRTDG